MSQPIKIKIAVWNCGTNEIYDFQKKKALNKAKSIDFWTTTKCIFCLLYTSDAADEVY